jgi:hypothetical protein
MREIKKFDGFAAHPSTTARRSLGVVGHDVGDTPVGMGVRKG